VRYRTLGRTGLQVSEIGFGCGPTAGLMVRGEPDARKEAVARALELGINYFDTAPIYGDTVSERHLAETLRELGANPIVVTKVALGTEDLGDIQASVVRSVESSLERLGRDSLELVQLHNRVAAERAPKADIGVGALLTVEDVLGPGGVLEGLETLRRQGRVRCFGCCAFGGEVAAVNQLIDSGRFDTILVQYSILNPSAWTDTGQPGPRSFGEVGVRAAGRGMGVIVLRALEAGALAAAEQAHPLSGGAERPGPEYQAKLQRAQALRFLTDSGQQTMAQAALRFVLSTLAVSTVLVGFSDVSQVEEAAAASDMGALPDDMLFRIEELRGGGNL